MFPSLFSFENLLFQWFLINEEVQEKHSHEARIAALSLSLSVSCKFCSKIVHRYECAVKL